jgi:tryptophan synthase alpha subunit
VGFGISRKEHIEALADIVDAVAVGSALVDVIADAAHGERITKVKAFMEGLGATSQTTGGAH